MSHSFSIRDFTSKMRTRDVFKCWPFPAGDATDDEVRSWLPPMPVKKFRWWSDQFTGGPQNPPPDEEEDAVSGELEESERSPEDSLPEEEEELEEEKSDDLPVEETDSRSENGERGSENSTENEAEQEEKLENPPVQEMDSRLENGERESEISTEKEVEEEQKEEEEEEEEKSDMVCPVCRDFNAATLTAVNAHIDGCLRKERRQRLWSKSIMEENKKKRKKRSIAEIFDAEEEEIEKEQEQEENPQERGQEQEQQRSEIETARPFGEDVSEASDAGGEEPIGHESEKSDEGGSNSVPEDPLLPSPEEEEEKLEMVCPVCRVFTAATVTAANAHIDSCLAQAVREERWSTRKTLCSNLNPKPQKKRSIAEILNVAPQIEGGESHVEIREEEEGGGGKDEERVAIKSKKKKKKKVMKKMLKKVMKKKTKVRIKRRGVELLKRSRKMMKKKTTTKKKKKKSDGLAATKDDAYKSKVQNSEDGSRELEGDGNKTVELDNIDASITHEKELDSEILSEEMNAQVKNGDSVGKQQEAVLSSISGIQRSDEPISGSTSGGCNIQEGTEESHCGVQLPTSDRHVKFSGKDCILGPEDRNSYDEAASNLASKALASSLAKEQSCGSDEATGNLEANRNDEQSSGSDEATGNLEANRNDDNNAVSIYKGKEVCPLVESKQFSNALAHVVAVQSFLEPSTGQEKSKHLVEKGESSSKAASCDKFDKGNTTPPHCSPYADVSRSLSALQAGQICRVNRQVFDSGAFISSGKFIDRLDDLSIQSAPMNSNASARKFLEPSSSNSASYNKGNERPGFRLPTYVDQDNNGKALSGRPSPYMLSADKIDNPFLLLGQGKGSVRDNRMDQNFIGLPLNSHGELINFSSSGKVGMNQPDTTSCTLRGSFNAPVNDIIHQNRKEEYLSLSERLVPQKALKDPVKPIPHYPARLGVTESHGRGRADMYQHNSDRHFNQSVQPLDSDLNLARSPFIEQNQLDKMPYHKGNGMISPKETSGLVSPSSSQPTVRLMGKDVPIGGTSKEKQQSVRGDVWAGEESRRKHCSAYAAVDNSSLGRFSKQDWVPGSQLQTSTENVLPSVKIQSNPSLQSTFLMKGNPGVSRNANSNLHHSEVPTSNAVYNRTPSDLPWQLKPQVLSFQSQALPTPQLTSSSQGELNDRKKHPHVTSSAFGFPFMRPVGEEQAKTSLVRSLPSWLSGSTHEWLPGTLASKSLPQDTLGNSFATPSVIHSADFQHTPNSVNSRCPRKTPPFPASTVQPPHVPGTPFAINSGSRNIIKVTDRLQLNYMTTEDHHPSTNTRKRLAADLVDLTRPNKLPNIGQSLSAGFQRNVRAVELDPRVNGASTSRRQNEAQNLNPTSYLGFDFSNWDGVATSSGPVKLSPGTKRVGRPSQNVDQDDNTRTKW